MKSSEINEESRRSSKVRDLVKIVHFLIFLVEEVPEKNIFKKQEWEEIKDEDSEEEDKENQDAVQELPEKKLTKDKKIWKNNDQDEDGEEEEETVFLVPK